MHSTSCSKSLTRASILLGASATSVLGGEINNSQRDHNRATLIQYINLGGSDSDTPRSTLSVSDPSTSGTVGDLPHVSTSSSARDLPCSSTSSASNQEQSSLEEFSASTDSGLGGSDVSSETEVIFFSCQRSQRADLEQSPDSLPDEEDNLFEEEPSNAIYERHMYLKKHGFPLWIPQPNMRLSRSYRRQGVSIGDVGIFTSDGGFDFLFKVCLPAGHPNNPNELPEGFSFLVLNTSDVCEFRAHSSHSHMSSTSVQKQEATFECSGSDGAVLTMPQGAYHEDLKNISRFRDYALTHAESWYQYATGPRGREVGNGKLHMVTGCDKTTSWGIATYSHLQSKRPEGSVTLLKFEAVGNERRCQQSSYPTYAWNYVGAVEAKVGPEEDELLDLGVQSSAPLRNQCTFIRSLTPTLGLDDWERLQLKVAASAKDRALEQSPKNPFASVLGAISSLPGNLSSMCGYGRGSTSKLTDTVTPARCTKAKVVVVHDSDWCSVIRDSVSNKLYS
ncbi:hypothetical protein K443DRAFT_635714 [Laccaria amethystina LaAM-08-1]|uniref:Uncharacterized protein n=1 Tax=Laccaria amethystina LaAM-08-1 TaxID=1095629 RepID=A0A0C9X4N0_9AGAR|nr:hypothetical protein K443DRAFT_635714 [Laccaria amethystina LaAM-08-1]